MPPSQPPAPALSPSRTSVRPCQATSVRVVGGFEEGFGQSKDAKRVDRVEGEGTRTYTSPSVPTAAHRTRRFPSFGQELVSNSVCTLNLPHSFLPQHKHAYIARPPSLPPPLPDLVAASICFCWCRILGCCSHLYPSLFPFLPSLSLSLST